MKLTKLMIMTVVSSLICYGSVAFAQDGKKDIFVSEDLKVNPATSDVGVFLLDDPKTVDYDHK